VGGGSEIDGVGQQISTEKNIQRMKENCDNYVMRTSLFESSSNIINMIK